MPKLNAFGPRAGAAAMILVLAATTIGVTSEARAQAPKRDVCPILGSWWRGHGLAMPGPNAKPTLIVKGRVRVPSAGYRLALTRDYSTRTTQRLTLRVIPPKGPAAQVVTTGRVRWEGSARPSIRNVLIDCRGRTIGRIRVFWKH